MEPDLLGTLCFSPRPSSVLERNLTNAPPLRVVAGAAAFGLDSALNEKSPAITGRASQFLG